MQVRKALAVFGLPIVSTALSFACAGTLHGVHAAASAPATAKSATNGLKSESPESETKQGSKSGSLQSSIASIEEKLYEHKYPGESDEQRLSRIEKFVYGAPQTGAPSARVQRLQASLNNEANAIDKVQTAAGNSTTSSASATSGSAASKSATSKSAMSSGSSASGSSTSASSTSASSTSAAVTSSPAFDSANYPRVTELETDMLNVTYVHEPLAQRLSRLEVKAFGSASKSSDLCERVDNLDEYAETHKIFKNHHDPLNSSTIAHATRPGVFSNSFLGSKSFSAPAAEPDEDVEPEAEKKVPVNPFVNGVIGTDQRLTSIEEFVYGHNYATRSVQDRLERLEKRLVPYEHNLAQKDVTYRVNNIWNILNVANTLNTAPTAAHPANTQAIATAPSAPPSGLRSISAPSQSTMNRAANAHHSWLHQLGKSLGSASISPNATNVPGVYPPDIAPKPGHLYVP